MQNVIIYDPSQKLSFDGIRANGQEDFLRLLRENPNYDVAIILPAESDSLSLRAFLRVVAHRAPLLAIIAIGSIERSLIPMLDLTLDEVPSQARLKQEISTLLERRKIMMECSLVGRSEALAAVADTILRIAKTDIPVLVVGESGTGKELVAQAIHNHSFRKDKPFVAISCAAIPETLLESQLFGHKKGSFTGAHRDFNGFFAQANGGTIFLDEIGEVPLAVQVKLLRVLETGEYFPIGSVQPSYVNARVIAATNKDLRILMERGEFREDLYYRISGVKIFIPPLRERTEDIQILASYFAKQVSEKNNVKFAGFSDDAWAAMASYHWPGNVRELRNLVETAVMLSGGSVVRGQDLEAYFDENRQVGRHLPVLKGDNLTELTHSIGSILALLQQNNALLHEILRILKIPDSLEESEKEAIIQALKKASGSRKKAAESLGISTRTLFRKMKKYNI